MYKYDTPMKGIDVTLLIIFGVNIFLTKSEKKWIKIICKLIEIIIFSFSIFGSITCIILYMTIIINRLGDFADGFADFIFEITGILFIFFTYFKRKLIINLLKLIMKNVKVKEKKLINNISLILLLISILIIIIFISFVEKANYNHPKWIQLRSLGFSFNETKYPKLYKFACFIILQTFLQRIWLLISPIIYCLIISYLFYIWKEKLQLVSSSLLIVNYDLHFYKILNEIKEQFILFEDCFSIYPFLWLSNIFFSFSGILIRLARTNSSQFEFDQLSNLFFSLFVTSIALVVIIVIFYVTNIRSKLMDEKNYLINIIEGHKQSPETLSLIHKIESTFTSIQFTVWSMASMSKPILPSYLGSVIAFAALFTQIELQFGKSNSTCTCH